MADPPGLPAGKLPPELLAAVLGDPAGWPEDVPLGPALGEDAAAILPPPGPLVVATDPITLTGEQLGRFAVLVNANDVAVTGARPRWFLAAVLLPPRTDPAEVRALFAALRESLEAVGAVLVGGHTEVTPVVARPVVVGQMLGPAGPRGPIASGGLRPGDALVQVGPAPVEGAAVLVNANDV
ncbi:MAG TPA: AIR synthase related protein, partial [Actinomycetota bacterium]|nr:AIR synthase related protein [Actinomycetota bacterium]